MAVARVRMIPPEDTDAETRKVYDGVLGQAGRISNFSQVLAHQPAALAGWMLPNEVIRLKNVKTDPDYVKVQQLVIIKTSASIAALIACRTTCRSAKSLGSPKPRSRAPAEAAINELADRPAAEGATRARRHETASAATTMPFGTKDHFSETYW